MSIWIFPGACEINDKLQILYKELTRDGMKSKVAKYMYLYIYIYIHIYIFNINVENTNNKGYNLINADFVLPRFKSVTYGRHSLRFLGPQLWSNLSKEERNIGTLATFKTTIRKKDVTSFLEGCGSECRLCLG